MYNLSWLDFKSILSDGGLNFKYYSSGNVYYLIALDDGVFYRCLITQSNPASSDQTDFENNYLSLAVKTLSPYKASYILPISIVPSTLTANTYYWSMRNKTSGNRMFIQKIVLTMTYGGVLSSTTPSKFAFHRFSNATPSGGNSLNVIKSDTSFPASNLLDSRSSDNGITTTGLVIENPFMPFSVVSQLATSATVNLLFPLEHEFTLICLNPGEGVVLSSTSSLLSGVTINGFVEWVERP